MAEDIGIIVAILFHIFQISGKYSINLLPFFIGEDRLFDAQFQIFISPEKGRFSDLSCNNSLEFLEQLMSIFQTAGHTMANKPGSKLPILHLPSIRHMDTLQILLKGKKVYLLVFVGITGSIVKITRVMCQIR